MAKRKEDTPPPGSPAWMTTFGDLMNLLLCFFVLLFSMSTVDEEKYQELVASLNSAFSVFDGGASAIGDGILMSNGVSQLNELDQYINSTGKQADSVVDGEELDKYEKTSEETMEEIIEQQKLENNELLAEMVQETIDENELTEQVEVSFTAQYIQLTMKGALLFDSGQDEVKESSMVVLNKVGAILEHYGSRSVIEIEGHTDNVPIHSSLYASNEELSSARALSVFYYLQENTSLDPVMLKHAGMGERVPVADNASEEGRAKNRRVEIRIYNPA